MDTGLDSLKTALKSSPYNRWMFREKIFDAVTYSKQINKVNDLSSGQYSVNKNLSFKTSMLRSDLCNYSDGYIVVKRTIDLLAAAANENDKAEKNFFLYKWCYI